MHINQETDENQPPKFKPGSKNALFVELASPDELGFQSRSFSGGICREIPKTTIW